MTDNPNAYTDPPRNRIRAASARAAYPVRYFINMIRQVTVLMKIPVEAVIEGMAIAVLEEPASPTIDDVTWAFNTWHPTKESKPK